MKENGIDVKFPLLLSEIRERDKRDRNRAVAPLVPADDAEVIARLRARGHSVRELRWGAVTQMIRILRSEEGVRLIAVSDPRKGGRPAGE